ncbi:MAG: hypothetical protein ABSF38_15635 [Verrucomicrobiota bacterium]|jgi:hypothetical protein
MAWIKRNKFFVLSMAAGLVLTAYCAFLFYKNLADVSAKKADYQSNLAQYNALQKAAIYPSQTNIDLANEDQRQAKALLADYQKAFAPFPPPPKEDEQGFKAYLGQTIFDLGTAATNAGVQLPEGFAFTFWQQQRQLNYPVENIRPWMEQLTEIKTLCAILYGARINTLVSLQRVRVSPSDEGPSEGFFDALPVTNAPQVATPYKFCFRGFSRELVAVLDDLARSSNCIIVKAVQVQHETEDNLPPTLAVTTQPVVANSNPNPPFERRRGMGEPPPAQRMPGNPPGGAPVTVLSERMLRVSMAVDVVKLSAGGK